MKLNLSVKIDLMVEAKDKLSSHWWWLDSQKKGTLNRSPWLQSTLSELDEKTESMLRIVEQDADSFAQRAEMYYKKRPQLINMVEDFYKTHRLLAEKYDQIKSESGTRLMTQPWMSPLSFTKYHPQKTLMSATEISYDSYSEIFDPESELSVNITVPESVLPNLFLISASIKGWIFTLKYSPDHHPTCLLAVSRSFIT